MAFQVLMRASASASDFSNAARSLSVSIGTSSNVVTGTVVVRRGLGFVVALAILYL
jgi:hypothetical protein